MRLRLVAFMGATQIRWKWVLNRFISRPRYEYGARQETLKLSDYIRLLALIIYNLLLLILSMAHAKLPQPRTCQRYQ